METLNVFGGTGFVGSTFVKRSKFHSEVNDRDDYHVYNNDVVYFISTVDNYNVFTDLHVDVDTNLTTLLNVLESIPEHNRKNVTFNFISSWFVYGSGPDECITYYGCKAAFETSPCDPKGFYSITKRAAEQLLISFCETHGMNYRILRLSNVVGVGDKKTSKKKNALVYLFTELLHNRPISLYDGGYMSRDIIHVNDVVNAIDLVLEKGKKNAIYNISNGKPVVLREFIELAKHTIGSTSFVGKMKTPEFHRQVQVESMYLNNDKIRHLGYAPKYSLLDIIYYLRNGLSVSEETSV